MRLCQLTPQQTLPDVQITPQEWKIDPEVSINHDDLYAAAWECEYERPIFDARYENAAPPNSPESDMRSDFPTKGTWNTSWSPRDRSPEICPRRDEVCDGKDTDSHTETDVETESEQHKPTPTNTRSSEYYLCHKPKPKCNDD